MEDEQLAGGGGNVGDDLHRRRARADDADARVVQAVQRPVRVTSCVRVIPPAGVKRMTSELLDARDTRELGSVERAVAHDQESSRDPVVAVGEDGPSQARAIPGDPGHLGREARALVEPEVPGDAAAVLQDLRGAGVLLAWDVGRLLQQGEVHVGLDVALCSGISVPVPGAAEVATLFDDAKVVDARLREPCPRDEARKAAADDRNSDVVDPRRPVEGLRVGITEVVGELSGDLDVLVVPVLPDSLVALHLVFLAQRVGIEGGRRPVGVAHDWELRQPLPICISLSSASAPQRSPADPGRESLTRRREWSCERDLPSVSLVVTVAMTLEERIRT